MKRIRFWKVTFGSLGILTMVFALASCLDSDAPRTNTPLILFLVGTLLLLLRLVAAKIERGRNTKVATGTQ